MLYQFKKIIPLCMAVATVTVAQAQSGKINNDVHFTVKKASELYLKGLESVAYPSLESKTDAVDKQSNIPLSAKTQKDYLTLTSRLKLNDDAAARVAEKFVADNYSEPKAQMLSYHVAEFFYRKENFEKALSYYNNINTANLTTEQLSDTRFNQGYSYFALGQPERAEPLFDAIRQSSTDKNYHNANYYYGYILFNKQRYDEALQAFEIVEQTDKFKTVVPYYIAEIYYFQNRKEQALSYALESVAKGGQYYEPELRQLIGHIYFEQGQYERAIPHLEAYVTQRDKVSREDLYELSYSYYATNQLEKAATGFKQLGGREDALAQNSMYILADTYLKLNDKANARNAFLFSSQNSSNDTQKEISKFNYAKLSHDLGYNDVAVNELKTFLSEYPSSSYRTEASEVLISALAHTNNFRESLNMVEQIGTSSELVQRVYPRILYGRSVELINDGQPAQAKRLLDRIFTLPYNSRELQPAYFWKGEAEYRLGNYQEAINALNKYLQNPQTTGEVNTVNARYNLGYAYLKSGNYNAALNNFQQIGGSATSTDPLKADAYVRAADALFMQRQYARASGMYDAVIKNNGANADYAYYQKAVIAGAHGRVDEKVQYLQQFNRLYANSSLSSQANMQIADAYMLKEDFAKAIDPLNKIISSNAVELHPEAYLKLGVAYYNTDNNSRALFTFRNLMSKFPHAEESNDAAAYVRNIYINTNRPQEYVSLMREMGRSVSSSERDSISFVAPFNAYASENFTTAKTGFISYINQYPSGENIVDANYFLGDIYNKEGDYNNAIRHLKYAADRTPNKFGEEAVLETARIYYFQMKDYNNAAKYYQQLKNIATNADFKLESMRGLLRSHYNLKQWQQATQNANELLKQRNIATDDRQIANMIIAKDMESSNANGNDILEVYKKVYNAGRNEYAAEARYSAARILTDQRKYSQAENMAFDVINKSGSYDYWITSAYVLLGEIYLKQKDYFNAEATLKSVIENAANKELVAKAQELLNTVNSQKRQNSKVR